MTRVDVAPPRVILHLDMDAFYAAVEVREDPSLAGKPLIIGHRGKRGVVSTCSYEARKSGVRSAMPSVAAERLCPEGIWLPGRMELYVEVSREIRKILSDASPIVEPLSIDEAFLDLTGVVPTLEKGCRAACALKDRIRLEQRLTASIGVAPNKFLAKIASDLEKPDGLVVLAYEDVPVRLWPMEVQRLWGVGPKTAARLRSGGIRTVRDLLKVSRDELQALVGQSAAHHLRALARGEDDRPVEAHRPAKSISEERTYLEDLTGLEDIDRAFLERSEAVARELRRQGLAGRTVHIKVRRGDFKTWTRSQTLRTPTDLAEVLVRAAREMFRGRIRLGGKGVRLLGVGVSGLEERAAIPEPLFLAPDESRARRLTRAADAVRDKLGEKAVVRARLLRGSKGEEPSEAGSLPSLD